MGVVLGACSNKFRIVVAFVKHVSLHGNSSQKSHVIIFLLVYGVYKEMVEHCFYTYLKMPPKKNDFEKADATGMYNVCSGEAHPNKTIFSSRKVKQS